MEIWCSSASAASSAPASSVRTGNAAALHAGPAVLISYAIAGSHSAPSPGLCYASVAPSLSTHCRFRRSDLIIISCIHQRRPSSLPSDHGRVCLLFLELWALRRSRDAWRSGWSGYVVSLLADYGVHIPRSADRPIGHHLQKGWRRRGSVLGQAERGRSLYLFKPSGNSLVCATCARFAVLLGHRRRRIGQIQQCHCRHLR